MGVVLEGVVVRGDGLGRKLGFPTANLDWQGDPPAPGVYEVLVEGLGRAVCNVGKRPTVGGKDLRVEVHIPGYSGDLYGKKLKVEFVRLIRGEKKFASLEELTAQIKRDLEGLS